MQIGRRACPPGGCRGIRAAIGVIRIVDPFVRLADG